MKYTEEQIQQMEGLINELMKINGELNARCIAFNAKLMKEEKKVHKLKQQLYFISQAFTNNTYQA